ncbi:TetR/AcrR family transcriptional regulator [Rhodococcus sp. P1Y]|uniref:TetR/AcrR family transcriptional regulator n=1 Tax=Rhodococcus sp. P1Y TaxID=1302308 RepID=UPI001379770B|nr:TetR/AcrR family transcriptional regulator [Rhodococcus sp. P1Y]
MAERGPYRNGEARREEILAVALTVVARVGYSGATVRELADAVGMSRSGLLHHFGTKDDLFAEILRRSDAFDVDRFATRARGSGDSPASLAASFLRVIRHHRDVPGLIPLYIRNAAVAAEPDHPDHDFHRGRQAYAHTITAAAFDRMQRQGSMVSDIAPDVLATLLLALQDGLKLQWLFDPAIDMPDAVTGFFRLLEMASRGGPARVAPRPNQTR